MPKESALDAFLKDGSIPQVTGCASKPNIVKHVGLPRNFPGFKHYTATGVPVTTSRRDYAEKTAMVESKSGFTNERD